MQCAAGRVCAPLPSAGWSRTCPALCHRHRIAARWQGELRVWHGGSCAALAPGSPATSPVRLAFGERGPGPRSPAKPHRRWAGAGGGVSVVPFPRCSDGLGDCGSLNGQLEMGPAQACRRVESQAQGSSVHSGEELAAGLLASGLAPLLASRQVTVRPMPQFPHPTSVCAECVCRAGGCVAVRARHAGGSLSTGADARPGDCCW